MIEKQNQKSLLQRKIIISHLSENFLAVDKSSLHRILTIL